MARKGRVWLPLCASGKAEVLAIRYPIMLIQKPEAKNLASGVDFLAPGVILNSCSDVAGWDFPKVISLTPSHGTAPQHAPEVGVA